MQDIIITNCQLYRPFHPVTYKLFQVRINRNKIIAIEENGYNLNKARVFDAKGRTVAPSFKDSHIHLLRYSLMKQERDLRRVHTWAHLQEVLTDDWERSILENNHWLVGRGLVDDHFQDRDTPLTAKDLDLLDVENPIFLLHQDGHECVLNSKALQQVEKSKLLEKCHDEFIEKDVEGNWTGRFKDTAVHFIKMNFRTKSVQEAREAIMDVFPHLAEYGITHVDSDDLNYIGTYDKLWQAYKEADEAEKKGLPFGVYLHHYVYDLEGMKAYVENHDLRSGEGEENMRVGAFKVFVDGTYRLHTAALNLPYIDTNTCGTLIYDEAMLTEMLQFAEDNRMQVAMHCIGDRAVETAAKAIISANLTERNPLRHRIIHMQNTRWDLLRLLHKNKIPVETQPGFLLKEWSNYRQWLGPDREKLVQAGRSLVDNEVIFTSSSDAPIGPLNPMEHIYAAVNRTDDFGKPDGGWLPQERLSIDEAFHSYCTTPCYLNHSEDATGLLMPGYEADLMLLEKHPHEVETSELNKLRVDALWYRGRLIFDRYD